LYANIIVDISLEKLDKTFQYIVPKELEPELRAGVPVTVPFGSRRLTGYVIELTDTPEYDVDKLRPVISVVRGAIPIESQLIALAAWIRKHYGGTMNQALRTVLPVRRRERMKEKKQIRLLLQENEAENMLAECRRRHSTAQERLVCELMESPVLKYDYVTKEKGIPSSVINRLQEKGVLKIERESYYRNPVAGIVKPHGGGNPAGAVELNGSQRAVVDEVMGEYERGSMHTYLLHGVTGSGKTEVYMELIARAAKKHRQSIVLIPEIALTFQTVSRFYERFGSRVTILHSRLSPGERYDQMERARRGEIDVIIGPRSALFTPFPDLGFIIIDEEHENSYKSESVPKYHARETAIARAGMAGASVVLGSATPSVESYYRAGNGEYRLLLLERRANERPLPFCEITDMRSELKRGNRSILSGRLQELMEDRLEKGQQTMLFLNRRGVAGFVSCRSCGEAVRCPHCDVSLSQHKGGRLICHYCGYEMPMVEKCPSCGSGFIGGFKAGTQKVQELVAARFPGARILRMDYDTTRTKDSYERILTAFADREADILIGTQMIVKGHDFPNVTLVGVLAADMSLNVSDYRAAERTFQLITQAAGRAGRGDTPGNVVIQTYQPGHFCIQAAAGQDYGTFYAEEILYRRLMRYPPVWNMLHILAASKDRGKAHGCMDAIAAWIEGELKKASGGIWRQFLVIGPADANIAKVNDVYRRVLYIKHPDYRILVRVKDFLEKRLRESPDFQTVSIQFDFNPMNTI